MLKNLAIWASGASRWARLPCGDAKPAYKLLHSGRYHNGGAAWGSSALRRGHGGSVRLVFEYDNLRNVFGSRSFHIPVLGRKGHCRYTPHLWNSCGSQYGLISALFFVIGLLFPEGVVRIFNREQDVVEAGAAYLRIACWADLATGVNMVFCIVLRSTENVKLPMYVSLVTTVLNAFMDYGLIFGAFGMPEMGIRGAALATVISAWAGPVLILAVSAIQRNMLISPIKELFGFNKRSIAEYYEKATPVIINETLWGLGTLLFSVIFANLGYQYYAAVTIFRTFENIAFVFFIGLCNASSIMVGKNVGAGHIKRAVEDSRRFVLFVSLCSVLTGVLIIIFRFQLASVFNLSGSITPETLKLTASLLLVYGIELPVRNLPYILIVGTFRPGGDTKIGMKLDLLSLWLCSVPLTTLAAFVFKLPFIAVFAIMYIAEDYLKVILCVKYYFTYNWLRPVTDQGIKGLEEFYESRRKKPADQ